MINWVSLISFLLVLLISAGIIAHYSSKGTKRYIYFFVFFGFFLAFGLVGLVPYDVYISQHPSSYSHDIGQQELLVMWQVAYWLSFVLCWFLLPIIQEYEISGEFNWKSRIRSAIYVHFRNFVIVGAAGLIILIILIVKKAVNVMFLPSYLVVLSNCWGLFLIIVFLGYGVVAVPRYFWKVGSYTTYLEFLYIKVTHLDEEVISATSNLDESVKSVCVATSKVPKNSMLQNCLDEILGICPQSLKDYHIARSTSGQIGLGAITESKLVELNRDLKSNLAEYKRTKCEWNKLIKETIYYEDIVESSASLFKRVHFTLNTKRRRCFPGCRQTLEWYWLISIKPVVYKVLAVLLATASVLIIFGETTLFINTPIALFPLMIREDYGIIASQLICIIPLSYILYCTYYAFFSLKLPGLYGLYAKNTESGSLVYCAYYLSRLSAPLSYNFFLLVKLKDSVFFTVMGNAETVEKAGNLFAVFFPLLLIVFSFLNYINAYARLLNLLGINQLSYFDETAAHKIYEGKNMIKREKLKIVENLNSANDWEMTNMEIMKDSGYNFGKTEYHNIA